jgi:hypothetical protein
MGLSLRHMLREASGKQRNDWLAGGKLRFCEARYGGHRHVPFRLSRMRKQPDPLPGLV